MRTQLTVCTMAAVTALVSGQASSQNLLINSSFEQLQSPVFGGGFVGWGRFNNMNPDGPTDNETPAFEGDVSVVSFGEFQGPISQSDSGLSQAAAAPDAAGKAFRATIRTRSNSGDGFATPSNLEAGEGNRGLLPLMFLEFRDSQGTIKTEGVQTFEGASDAADEWIPSVVQGIAPAGTTEVLLFLLFIQFDDAPGSVFWDFAEIVEVDTLACVADLTGDGVADEQDAFTAVRSLNFSLEDNGVVDRGFDYNGDDNRNMFDIVDFLRDRDAGCP
ncbi:MAG: hypothetical protein AAFO89_13880 [Planctomycetota bacterium]